MSVEERNYASSNDEGGQAVRTASRYDTCI